jgi:hypothetical protein
MEEKDVSTESQLSAVSFQLSAFSIQPTYEDRFRHNAQTES